MASSELPGRRNSNTQLLEELEALSQSLYQTHIATTTRRTASLALPRSSAPAIPSAIEADTTATIEDGPGPVNPKPRSRRMSLSPWLSRPKDDPDKQSQKTRQGDREVKLFEDDTSSSNDKKGVWKWKPIRALSHIGMQKLSCLFSVEVVAAQGLPASMNGLRLSVCVRKKETKDGSVHTMPSRVSQGGADFEETLFVKCHVYCSGGTPHQLKFEPRPFLIYLFAVDAAELDFGRSSVDLSRLIRESVQRNAVDGARIRQWDTSFDLAGKAKGGQLVLKLAFQIMEKDGGLRLFSQIDGSKSAKAPSSSASTFGRKQSKSSFSIPSPKISSRTEVWTPTHEGTAADVQAIDDLNLDDPAPAPAPAPTPAPLLPEEVDLPEFEVVDKGVEIQTSEETKEEDLTVKTGEGLGPESSEVVKEVVDDQFHLTRLTELDSIAQQIKALESLMSEESLSQTNEETDSQRLDADEETVTMEFLQMLEAEEAGELKHNMPPFVLEQSEETADGDPSKDVFLPDLGKGLGCVVQIKNGGFLTAMNPSNVLMSRKDVPKLAMQVSKPIVLTLDKSISGFEVLQRAAAIGHEKLSSELLSLMPIEDLMGKTAEQAAFEGIASTIISGRNKEGASSRAARSLAAVKKMASSMSAGRKERIATGIWNVGEDPLPADEILAFSIQKIEAMSIDALKIEGDMAEEEAPFDVSPLSGTGRKEQNHPLATAVPLEDWVKNSSNKHDDSAAIAVAVLIQLRDPLRRYEAVGGPMMALIHAAKEQEKNDGKEKFRVTSLHMGGMKVQRGQRRNAWDTERQRLTAMQWLIAYNLVKAARKGKTPVSKENDMLWSISARVVADMWLKPIRNPDVKLTK